MGNIIRIKEKMDERGRNHYKVTCRFFDNAAKNAGGYFHKKGSIPDRIQPYIRKIVLNQIKASNDKYCKILDIGCGMGDFSIILARFFSESKIIGVDISDEMIKLGNTARATLNIQNVDFQVANILNTNFIENEFDASIVLNMIHHIHKEDLEDVISEISRITKKLIIIEIKNKNNIYYPIKILKDRKLLSEIAVNPTTISDIRKILQNNGFELKNISPIFKIEWISPIIILTAIKR